MRATLWIPLVLLLSLASALTPVARAAESPFATQPDEGEVSVVDGEVGAVATNGRNTLLGGWFSTAGRRADGGALVSAADGHLLRGLTGLSAVDALVSIPGGGWYVGAGSEIRRVTAQGEVDPTFRVRVEDVDSAGRIESLVLSPDGTTLYVAGDFVRVGGVARSHLAAVSTLTAATTPWRPAIFVNTYGRHALDVTPDGRTVVVAGRLGLGGDPYWAAAAIDAATAAVRLIGPEQVALEAYAVPSEPSYVLSALSGYGTSGYQVVAAFDSNELTEQWRATADLGGIVGTVLDRTRGLLYVSGRFEHIGGVERAGSAALDVRTGIPTAWQARDPDPAPSLASGAGLERSPAGSLALSADGSILYSGTSAWFWDSGFDHRTGAYRTADGAAVQWDPGFIGGNAASVRVLSVSPDGDAVLLGGNLQSVNGRLLESNVMLDEAGAPTAWEPSVPTKWGWEITDVALGADDTSFLADLEDRAPEAGAIRAVDADGGQRWRVPVTGEVGVIRLSPDGTVLYIGGKLSSVGGFERSHLAAVRVSDGAVLPWAPRVSGGSVEAVEPSPDGRTIYAGGAFPKDDGGIRAGVLAFSAEDARTVGPAFAMDGAAVCALAVTADGEAMYVGGNFDQVDGEPRPNLARVSTADATVSAWSPAPNRTVDALALSPDSAHIVAGGAFSSVAGAPDQRHIAAYEVASGELEAWDPELHTPLGSQFPVRDLEFSPDGRKLHVAGGFDGLGPSDEPVARPFYARFTVEPTPVQPAPTATPIATPTPTASPTSTPALTPTPTPSPTSTLALTPTPTPSPTPTSTPATPSVRAYLRSPVRHGRAIVRLRASADAVVTIRLRLGRASMRRFPRLARRPLAIAGIRLNAGRPAVIALRMTHAARVVLNRRARLVASAEILRDGRLLARSLPATLRRAG
jgi:hypothetical protein